jgi:hypothetical protein
MVRVFDDASLYEWFLQHKKDVNRSLASLKDAYYYPTF